VDLVHDTRILKSEQVMTSSLVVHFAVYLRQNSKILNVSEVLDLVNDFRILTSEQVMTSSLVIPYAVYLK